ncbi:MAG TPA: PIN domain-containing protein [Bryobacteraceae bacterium]|nr:PIN domain-containing protein [Bryobacteraceae bacterium]
MILVDTSVWVDHFRSGNDTLAQSLEAGAVLTHPFVIGELACGNLRERVRTIAHLHQLPLAVVARDQEVLQFVEQKQLWSLGIGWVDAHLLASARLTNSVFWALDTALHKAAARAGVDLFR